MPQRLNTLFFHYLLDRRLIGQGELLEDGLADLDKEDNSTKNQHENQRILLEVEKQRRAEREKLEAQEKAIVETLSNKLNQMTANEVAKKLTSQVGEKLDKLLNRPFLDILSISLYKNLSIKQLANVVSARSMTERRLLELARTHEMAELVGKLMPANNKPSALNTIGYMGLDNARVFAYLVTAKPARVIKHEQFPSFQKKLWRYCLSSGFILRDLTAAEDVDPLLAFYAGCTPGLTGMLVLDSVDEQFSQLKRNNLSRFRNNQKYREYNALLDAHLNPRYFTEVLPGSIKEFEDDIFARIKRSLSQTRQTIHLTEQLPLLQEKLPVAQQVAKVWMLERSKLASTEKLLSMLSEHDVEISTELSRFASMKSRLSLKDYQPLVAAST